MCMYIKPVSPAPGKTHEWNEFPPGYFHEAAEMYRASDPLREPFLAITQPPTTPMLHIRTWLVQRPLELAPLPIFKGIGRGCEGGDTLHLSPHGT